MKITFYTLVLCLLGWNCQASLRALRIDPSYFYKLYPGLSTDLIIDDVISSAKEAGVNTLYLYAYSPVHGAFYKTDYPLTEIEATYGEGQVFLKLLAKAKGVGLKVVAVIPANDFRQVWLTNPSWRSKKADGSDYKPFERSHLLSAWHPAYRNWFKGFISDLLKRLPGIYALELVEPTVDCFWTGEPDYNTVVTSEFFKRYPQGKLGDTDWKKVRALGITQLVSIMATLAHQAKILSGVVQTWPAQSDGNLHSSDFIRNQVGFDFDGILNLKGLEKVDLIAGEFLWQQWLAEYGNINFTPSWTTKAANKFISFVGKRATPILHVEISPWSGQTSTVTPTVDEFKNTLKVIRNMGVGIDVYDQSQIQTRDAWSALSIWNTPLTDNTTSEE